MDASVKMKFSHLPLYVVGHLKLSGGEVRAQQLGRRNVYWAYLWNVDAMEPAEAEAKIQIMQEEFAAWKRAHGRG